MVSYIFFYPKLDQCNPIKSYADLTYTILEGTEADLQIPLGKALMKGFYINKAFRK